MKDNFKRVLISGLIMIVSFSFVIPCIFVSAASVKISASRDDIYNQLLAAANINVTANTFKKCISHIYDESDSAFWGGALNASEIADYDIFDGGNTTITASLWLENEITGEATDSAIWCDEGGSSNIFKQLTRVTDTDWSYWVCDGGKHGLLQRTSDGKDSIFTASKLDPDDKNCNSFNDSGSWLKATDAVEQFKILYTRWRNVAIADNPFIPTYDELGNFSNVDGYFAYIADFNAKCTADKETASTKQSSTDYTPIVKDTIIDNSIKSQTLYYHVNDNKTWKYSLSSDNPVASCQGLLDRISVLENTFNGIERNSRSSGYAGNILAELEDACKNAKTQDGENGWLELKTKLQEIIDDPEASEDLKTEATTNLEKLNDIIDNNKYVESSGTEDSDDGKLYQCADIDGLDINVEEFESGAIDISDPDVGTGANEMDCANSGGAMSLGWIVCPLLDWMGNAATSIYDDFVEPQLEVKASLFDESMSATKNAWEVFRNIANICFVILLLVVIFSQLTGVGIDNYGIKRILPKLIVAAILINLSYYICLIAVDISNILGNGLQALFNGLQSGTVEINLGPNGGGWGGNTSQEVASTTITGVAILALLVTMVGSIWANPAILLSLLVGALGVVIAIFFLFILLAARQAAIVVLVVLSPIAFACYMLPNTKKIFDKWTQMSKGLLLVYPIAGLLVGGGNFVSKLLLSTGIAADGFFSALTAMIVGIIPIFFIPTVLKGSFAAVGNLGAKISGFGDRFRGRVDKGVRNSERYKDTSARWRAGQNKNGDMTRIGKLRARSAEGKFAKGRIGGLLGLSGVSRSQARGIAEVEKRRGEDEAASASLIGAMSKEGIAKAGSENAYYESKFLAAAASGNVSEMNAAIEAARKSNMKPKDIAKMVRNAQNSGNLKFKDGATRSAWYRDLSRRYGNDFLATDFELSSFAQTGGTGNSGVLGNYGDYVKPGGIGIDDIKPEDVGKLSGDSLAGLAKSGLIDQSLAERSILSNPNLSADKKIMLSAIASGAADSTTITSVKDFKDDAEQLMKNHANTTGLKTMTAKAVTQAMVDAWASVTPESVNVVQNFQGGGPGQVKPVDVDIKH